MRLHEFRTDEEQLDEILPLIPIAGAVARAAVGGAGRLAGKAALGLGKAAVKGVAKGVGKLAKGAVKGVANTAKAAVDAVAGDDEPEEPTNNPNAKVGTQVDVPKANTGAAEPVKTTAKPTGTAKPAMGATTDLRTGGTVELPTKGPGGKEQFKVTRAQGDDIEIEDPKDPNGPKMIYKRKDLERAMSQ